MKFFLPVGSLLVILMASCHNIRPYRYFLWKENQVDSFSGYFVKDPLDSNYSKTEKLFGAVTLSDTFCENYALTYKTFDVDGEKAFYAIASTDRKKEQGKIGTGHFLHAALICRNDSVLVAPGLGKDTGAFKLRDFAFVIPPRIHRKDSVVLVSGRMKLILHHFNSEKLAIGNKRLHCLKISITESWPGKNYYGTAWLNKNYGVVKWIRTTGRTDTRIF
jgi:hypothetical protein